VLAKVLPLVEGTVNDLKVELVHDDDLGMVLRATESRILPFEWELATQAFWEVIPTTTSVAVRIVFAVPVSQRTVLRRKTW
jgi:hypothetical protein